MKIMQIGRNVKVRNVKTPESNDNRAGLIKIFYLELS